MSNFIQVLDRRAGSISSRYNVSNNTCERWTSRIGHFCYRTVAPDKRIWEIYTRKSFGTASLKFETLKFDWTAKRLRSQVKALSLPHWWWFWIQMSHMMLQIMFHCYRFQLSLNSSLNTEQHPCKYTKPNLRWKISKYTNTIRRIRKKELEDSSSSYPTIIRQFSEKVFIVSCLDDSP